MKVNENVVEVQDAATEVPHPLQRGYWGGGKQAENWGWLCFGVCALLCPVWG